MSTICLVCGSRGIVEALNYCSICKAVAQHRYCFERIPEVLNADFFWVCKYCSSRKVKDENLFVETEVGRSNSQVSPKMTHSIEAENVCRAYSKSVPTNEISLPPKKPQHNSNDHAQPILNPIWRGTMNIRNKNWTLHGLGAHLSTQAHYKVSNMTNLFPDLLPLEILPRSAVWPKTFGSSSGTFQDGDIGLYFFPVNASDEKAFDDLLDDMMWNDLAVKASFGSADLLIFTSLQLPMQHWRYQKKIYLWGLFRVFSSKSTLKTSPCSR